MARFFVGVGIVAAVAALVSWNFYFKPRRDAVVEPPAVVDTLPLAERSDVTAIDPEAEAEPQPVPQFLTAEPEASLDAPPALPALDESDDTFLAALSERFGSGGLASLLVTDGVIRKAVVTIDNLPRDRVSMKVRAVPAVSGRFAVVGEGRNLAIGARNYARYANFVATLESVDPNTAVDLYIRFYPLLQQAFEDLGYPGQPFHHRLLAVTGHLLDTPRLGEAALLERPHVLYRYADEDLESLSAGQKILLRMGSENAARTQAWLSRFRDELQRRDAF